MATDTKEKNIQTLQTLLSKPDFAKPADVCANAGQALEIALRNDAPSAALQAAVQLTIARNSITSDSIVGIYEMLHKLPDELRSPYKEVAYLLEANFLSNVYGNNRYNYNQRKLPLDEISDNPKEWSGDQFSLRIVEACKRALEHDNVAAWEPLASIEPLIEFDNGKECKGLSIFDFIVYNIMELADSNPNIHKKIDIYELFGKLVKFDTMRAAQSSDVRDGALLLARICQLSNAPACDAPCLSQKIIDDYANTPAYSSALSHLYISYFSKMTKAEKQKFYILVCDAMRQMEGNKDKNRVGYEALEYISSSIAASDVSITAPDQVLPGDEFEVSWISTSCTRFNLLLVKVPDTYYDETLTYERRMKMKDVKRYGVITRIYTVECDNPIPFIVYGKVSFDGVPAGYYALVAADGETLETIRGERTDFVTINVSELTYLRLDDNKSNYISIVSGRNGQPIRGAKVLVYDGYDNNKLLTRATSDKMGIVQLPENGIRYKIRAVKDDNRIWFDVYNYRNSYRGVSEDLSAAVLTDLAIYHPGDSVKAVVILSECVKNNVTAKCCRPLVVKLFDSNGEEVDQCEVTTDMSGRAVVSLAIPKDGMTGTFLLRACDQSGSNWYGQSSVQVAEYKAPTLRVELERPVIDEKSLSEDKIRLKGNVSSYTGLPLPDCEVTVEIEFKTWDFFFRGNSDEVFSLQGKTDADGNFEVTIGQDNLKNISKRFGIFTAVATATSLAGETRSSNKVSFSLGEHYSMQCNLDSRIEITPEMKELTIPVQVTDALGNVVQRPYKYCIEGIFGSETLIEGESETSGLKIDTSLLPSGQYKLTFITSQPQNDCNALTRNNSNALTQNGSDALPADTLTVNTIIWRNTDRIAPSPAPVWTPRQFIYAEPGQNSVKIPVGNAYKDGYIYMMVVKSNATDNQTSIDDRLQIIPVDACMKNVNIEAPGPGERIRVYFYGVYGLKTENVWVEVRPAVENVKYKIYTETFRDHISPTSSENWVFRLEADGTPVSYASAVAVMTNKALNDITPFSWRFEPLSSRTYNYACSISSAQSGTNSMNVTWQQASRTGRLSRFTYPQWNFYDGQLYSEYGMHQFMRIRGTRMYKSSATSGSVAKMNKMMDSEDSGILYDSDGADMYESDYAAPLMENSIAMKAESVEESENGSASVNEDTSLRDIECPIAFFRPLLSADESGDITLSFEVPDFNTEWQLQLIGYDKENMSGARLVKSVIASKPVMIQTNMPRFLRTGDKSVIEAMIFNNSDETAELTASIEIFNPQTGEILQTRTFDAVTTPPSGSNVVGIEINVPDNIESIAVRARVRSDKGSDGEQGIIPILPSSQPVYDAETWYLNESQTSMRYEIPKLDKRASVTLEYCDNPAWYTLMSLNTLLDPEGESAIILADAVYSNSVGAGVLRRNPVMTSMLKRIVASADSVALTSPLALNQSLKLNELNNTPWVNNAEAETARMRNIARLTDETDVKRVISGLIQRLGALQASDGGWSWCAGMPSSRFMTKEVLWRFAAMISTDDMVDGADSMIKAGVSYYDKEIEREWNEAKRKGLKYHVSFSDVEYFYVRDRFVIPESDIISKVKQRVMEQIKADWKKYDISMKCLSAMMLYNAGDKNTASNIMESVRQFASSSTRKGEWFDGATGSLSRTSPVMSTAIGLMAFNMLNPNDKDIPALRQYLLLSRQSQDWYMTLSTAKVVIIAQAILSTGNRSEEILANRARITIDGEELDLSDYAGMPGSMVIDLDPGKVSGKIIEISRPGGTPAWGGIISSYVASIKEIKPRSMEQIRIEKALYPVTTDNIKQSVGARSDRFKKGDRVLVTLTVTTDRDLDYLQIRDERGAWMEPREQLTQYQSQDGVWSVREQRNSYANIYIYHLPKGVHVLSYEITADRDGEYVSGTATAQSQYYPFITARSGITSVRIE
ncbi:MAG: hypothetical protein K2H86_04565 [Muribaculaceae bacterium]|nr:hypothetical protein [Muribaculaceae bacterium]